MIKPFAVALTAAVLTALSSADTAFAHEDASVPNAWAKVSGSITLENGAAVSGGQRRHADTDKCATIQGELYLKCGT